MSRLWAAKVSMDLGLPGSSYALSPSFEKAGAVSWSTLAVRILIISSRADKDVLLVIFSDYGIDSLFSTNSCCVGFSLSLAPEESPLCIIGMLKCWGTVGSKIGIYWC